MRNGRRTSLAFLIAAAAALVLVVAPVAAAGQTQFGGTAAFTTTDECQDPSPNAYPPIKMSGGLVGCWYTNHYTVKKSLPNGIYRETGDETFVGCLADGKTCGTFNTTYHFEARFAPDGSEIRGHCEHPLVSGTGGFAGITGEVFFKDNVEVPGTFDYQGHLMMQ